jgi:hypothetical protein
MAFDITTVVGFLTVKTLTETLTRRKNPLRNSIFREYFFYRLSEDKKT